MCYFNKSICIISTSQVNCSLSNNCNMENTWSALFLHSLLLEGTILTPSKDMKSTESLLREMHLAFPTH